jgi:hypothetical protein
MQDWGVELADASRCEEFAKALAPMLVALQPETAAAAVDLVLQSAEERLDQEPSADLQAVRRFIAVADAAAIPSMAYWRSLRPSGADQWRVAGLL